MLKNIKRWKSTGAFNQHTIGSDSRNEVLKRILYQDALARPKKDSEEDATIQQAWHLHYQQELTRQAARRNKKFQAMQRACDHLKHTHPKLYEGAMYLDRCELFPRQMHVWTSSQPKWNYHKE
jgi:hypothetical protein